MPRGDPREVAGVREGQVLAGKYRVEKVLGVGGMGAVVAAHHLQLDTKVALKFLLPAMLEHPEAVGRFSREARSAVKITSEHVARVFDVGTLHDGAPYMVMEFLEGVDLGTWLRHRGPLPVEQAVDFVLQACVAVADAHSLGIVHRDLKPANLFRVRRNDGSLVIKVLDFGISKASYVSGDPGASSMTQTSTVMGSPLYMSPEQMQSTKDVDAQTDIWAVGITLYELLTGVTPFVGDSYAEIAIRVATAPLSSPRSIRADTPAGLEEVISRCLAKDKRHRFADMAALAQALAEFGSPRSRSSVEQIVGILRSAGFAGITQSQTPASRASASSQAGSRPSQGDATTLLPDPSVLASMGTMAPSATTSPGVPILPAAQPSKGPRRRKVTAILVALGALAMTAVAGVIVQSMQAPSAAHPLIPPTSNVTLRAAATSPMASSSGGGSSPMGATPTARAEPKAVAGKPADSLVVAATAPGPMSGAPARGAIRESKRAWPTVPPAAAPADPPTPTWTADRAPPPRSALPSSPEDSDPLAKLKPK
jgi:serine/threonine-protein kinase